jgi:hypothetical protein
MPHASEMIEHTLTVSTDDESEAVAIAEMLARFTVALSAQSTASIAITVERFEVQCRHAHDDEHEVGS